MMTIGQIEAAVRDGHPVPCCRCQATLSPSNALMVTMDLTVERVTDWGRPSRDTTRVVLTPLCPSCKDSLVPASGSVVSL